MATAKIAFIAALAALIPSASHSQNSGSSPGVKELGDLTGAIAKFERSGVKGWTCRGKDGRAMHRLDPTNIARMGKIPSSNQGFVDTKTPVESLQPCTEPQ